MGTSKLVEPFGGEGRLLSLGADAKDYVVRYEYTVETEISGTSETFDPARIERRYTVNRIEDPNGETTPTGEYTLKITESTLRIRKTGRGWTVVIP